MRTDVQSPGQWLVTYDFDEFGNTLGVTTYKDAATPRETTYVYDKLNRVTETDHPGTLGTEKFQYDKVGNLRAKMDGNGAITVYEYDALNRARKVLYDYEKPPYNGTWPVPDAFIIETPSVTYTYHCETSLVKTMVDSVGTTSYDYDYRNRMVSYAPPVPADYDAITYQYDNANNKTAMVTPQGTTTYTYYKNGWLRQVSANSGVVVVSYDYDPAGNRTLMTRNNNTNTQTAFDPRDRVSGIVHNASGSPFASVAYTRDGLGSPLTANWTNSQTWTVTYGYDAMNRLQSENHSIRGLRNWTYDWVGNRLDTGFVYDPATDELTEGPTGVLRQYSTAGSMTLKATTTYAHNPQELLRQVGTTTTMDWDAEQRRLRLNTAGNTYQFVYDPTAGIPAIVFEDRPASDVWYVRDPDGSLIARIGTNGVRYYHFDQLGSTVCISDSAATVTDRYDYGAWGEPHPILAGTTDNPYLYVGQLGYYTHWQDPSLADALELGVRLYEPGIGGFTQRDPLGGNPSQYVYADGSPTLLADPSGLKCTPVGPWQRMTGIGPDKWEYRFFWRFLDWHKAEMTAGRACYCHFVVDEYRRRVSTRTYRRPVSCMYWSRCGWTRSIEYEYRDVPYVGPWQPSPRPSLDPPNRCSSARTEWGVILGERVKGDQGPHVWCSCQIKKIKDDPNRVSAN